MRTAIVIPGHGSFDRRGRYRISGRCASLVGEAGRLARRSPPEAVVFSGWGPPGSRSEAEQMRGLWRGDAVELVVEPTARTTAENAARTLPLLRERGIERALVVCAPLHLYRTRYFFRRLYGQAGIEVAVRVAPVAPSLRALLWELLALPLRRDQLRAAEDELRERSAA
ncbi:MAG TPA: YdcF family protein [Gaiellaceae bacterium]|nr:YdcF family protein [Gaiellaceae bacterium]